MKLCILRILALCAGISFSIAGYGAQAPPQAPVITSNVDEVSMDVIAHDKHGRPIRDLKPDELQIIDDGHAAKITALRLVSASDATSAHTGGAAHNIRSVSFVFDALHGDANSIALRAAAYLLRETGEKDFYFSVWRLTTHLELAQTLTNDQVVLKRALETTLKPASRKLQPVNSTSQPPPSPIPQPVTKFANEFQTTAALATRIGRDENVPPFVAGLLALIRQQSSIPGRKTI